MNTAQWSAHIQIMFQPIIQNFLSNYSSDNTAVVGGVVGGIFGAVLLVVIVILLVVLLVWCVRERSKSTYELSKMSHIEMGTVRPSKPLLGGERD